MTRVLRVVPGKTTKGLTVVEIVERSDSVSVDYDEELYQPTQGAVRTGRAAPATMERDQHSWDEHKTGEKTGTRPGRSRAQQKHVAFCASSEMIVCVTPIDLRHL